MASYLDKVKIQSNTKAMTKLRLSSHKLMIERGRWLKMHLACMDGHRVELNTLHIHSISACIVATDISIPNEERKILFHDGTKNYRY